MAAWFISVFAFLFLKFPTTWGMTETDSDKAGVLSAFIEFRVIGLGFSNAGPNV